MAASTTWWFPMLYIGILGFLFFLFVRWNNARLKRENIKLAEDSYFGRNVAKDQYLELTEMYSPETEDGLKILSSSLMRRAMEDVKRIWQIREEKPPLMNLVKQGAIGEDLWEKVVRAEQELEAEILEVLEEADLYRKGWRDTIFQEASKYMQIQIAREAQLQAQMEAANNASPGQDETEEAGEGEDDSEEAQTASPSTPEEEQLTEEERSQRAMEELIRDEELEKQKLAKKQQQSPQNSNGKAGGKKKKKK